MPLKRKTRNSNLLSLVLRFRYISLVLLVILVCAVYFINDDRPISQQSKNIFKESVIEVVDLVSRVFPDLNNLAQWGKSVFESKELEALREENAKLEFRILQVQADLAELAELRRVEKFQSEASEFIASGRIARSNINTEYYTLIFPAGIKAGINDTCYALDRYGYLVGKVVEVYDNYSVIEPINSPRAKTPVFLTGSNQNAIIEGEALSHSKLSFFYLADRSKLLDGEVVVTSQHGVIFPYGIPLGVLNIESSTPIVRISAPPLQTEYVEIHRLKAR